VGTAGQQRTAATVKPDPSPHRLTQGVQREVVPRQIDLVCGLS